MPAKHRFKPSKFFVDPKKPLDLSKRSTRAGKELDDKEHGQEALAADVEALKDSQRRLYASDSHSLLIILQGMDAAGKDGTIRHVMGGVNPQGCRVYSFKAPSSKELEHHFLARPVPCLPARGMISIFNRSYYEEVLVVRVHPEFLEPQRLPGVDIRKKSSLNKLWKRRFREIRAFEQTLVSHGTHVLKFYLHLSMDEQRERFLERLTMPEKYWKFNAGDLSERKLWSDYRSVFEDALTSTSTAETPWYAIPADNKWYARAAIADIIAQKLESLDLQYPEVESDVQARYDDYAEQLRNE